MIIIFIIFVENNNESIEHPESVTQWDPTRWKPAKNIQNLSPRWKYKNVLWPDGNSKCLFDKNTLDVPMDHWLRVELNPREKIYLEFLLYLFKNN